MGKRIKDSQATSRPEDELKFELTKSGYEGLLNLLPGTGKVDVFSNHYYGVGADCPRKDWVLRLRQRPQDLGELTLKIGRQLSAGSYSSTEVTTKVECIEPESWEGTEPLKVLRAEISSKPLISLGSVTNERRLLKAPWGPICYWELDLTKFPGDKLLYELEIEYPEDNHPSEHELVLFQQKVNDWAHQHSITLKPSLKTKYQRFLECIKS